MAETDHFHEQGEWVPEAFYVGLWRCKHCDLERSRSYWQRYRANLKHILEVIQANGLPDHEEREDWAYMEAGHDFHIRVTHNIIRAYRTWTKGPEES